MYVEILEYLENFQHNQIFQENIKNVIIDNLYHEVLDVLLVAEIQFDVHARKRL